MPLDKIYLGSGVWAILYEDRIELVQGYSKIIIDQQWLTSLKELLITHEV